MHLDLTVSLILSLCLGIWILCSAIPLATRDKSFVLSIIHFSDFHARFVQVSPSGGLCYDQDRDKCVGGVARVATVVEQLKRVRDNPIFLNAGDCFQGTLYYDLFKGNITAYFMNRLGPDAHTIGNHDFDDGTAGFASYARRLNSPVVATNIDDSEEPSAQDLFTNSTVVRRGGRDIGVIGVIYSDTDKISTTTGKLKFLSEVQTVDLEAAKLKARGVDIIVVLSHCGIEHDRIMASSCPDVDVVVGGHSHVLLYNGIPPSGEVAYGQYPMVVTQRPSQRKVLIVHASAFTKYVGDLRVVFNDAGEVTRWEGNPIYLDESVKEDSSLVQTLTPWKVAVDRVGKRPIGETLVFLNGTCYSGECNLANLVTDAMVDHYANEASIGFVTANSIQNSVPKGSILYEDAYTTLPYNNTWDLVELKGRDLLEVLEENVAKSSSDTSFVNYLLIQWSGLRVVYDLANQRSRVVSARVRCLHCHDGAFEALDNEQWYRVVVPTYLLGQDFPTIRRKHRSISTGNTRDLDNLVAYIEKKKVVDVATESRMVFL